MDTRAPVGDGGYAAGFDAGRREGYLEGQREGYLEGHRAGFFEGHREGWEQGRREAGAGPVPLVQQASPAPTPPLARPAAPRRDLPPTRHATFAPPGPPPRIRPVVDAAQAADSGKRRERRTVQNVNIALYAAALLMVAAAALFLASTAAAAVRLAGLIAVTALFYGAGLVVHARIARLRPAAVALTGTGLALLPVAGLALDGLVIQRPAVTWLATSLVGLLAFGFAALRLESRLLVYLSLTFAFSAAWSGSSALGGALAADFAALLGVSAILGAATVLRPRWIPPLVLRPIARMHPYVAPATFLAATFAYATLERWHYPLLVAAIAAYFGAAAWVRGQTALRRASWWAALATAAVAVGTASAQAAQAGLLGRGTSAVDAGLVASSAAAAASAVLVSLFRRRLGNQLSLSSGLLLAQQCVTVGVQFVLLLVLFVVSDGHSGPAGAVTAAFVLAAGSAQLVAWWHGRAGEFLPVAALAALTLVQHAVGAFPFAILATWCLLYWLMRAAIPLTGLVPDGDPLEGADSYGLGIEWARSHHVAAARLASLVAVPAIVGAALPAATGGAARTAAVAAGLAAAAAAQLAGTAIAAALARAEFARGWMMSAFAVAAGSATLVVCVNESRGGFALHSAAVGAVCCSALAVAAALFPREVRGNHLSRLRPGADELVPPLLLAGVAGGAFAADRWGAGNAALVVLAGVLAWSAWRSAPRARRWAYVWLARASATVAAGSVFHAIAREGWVLAVAGETLTVWHVFAAAALVQLAVPLVSEVRGGRRGTFPWALEDASFVLGAAAVASGVLWALHGPSFGGGGRPGPVAAALIVGLAGGSALAGAILRRRAAALALAPAALPVSAFLAGGDLRLLEILVGLFSAYAAAMVWLVAGRTARGLHLVAARALPLVLMVLIAQDATASRTAVSVTLALGLAVQHLVRRALSRAVAELPFQEAAYWSGLAAQLGLPIAYAMTSLGEPGGGRWVLLLESALALVSVVATLRTHPRAGYVGVAALGLALVWAGPALRFPFSQPLAAPLLDQSGLVTVLAVLAAVHAGCMVRWEGRESPVAAPVSGPASFRWPWTAGAAAFAAGAVVESAGGAPWLGGLGMASCAATLLAASWAWRGVRGVAEATFPLGGLAVLAAGTAVGRSIFEAEPVPWSGAMPLLVGAVVPAGVGVALRWSPVWAKDDAVPPALTALGTDPVRRWTVVGVAAVALLIAGSACWEPPAAVVLPLLAAALSALVIAELPHERRRLGAELGALAVTAALERAVFAGHGHVSLFWLAQWYVVLGAVMALLRYYGKQRRAGRCWLGAAAGLASLTAVAAAFASDTPEQVWLLVAFAVLTAVGLVTAEKPFTVWGSLGVLACVLWAVRAYPYLLLAALGLALIGAAVWWLVRAPRGTLLR